jgi:hypothetical protein
LKDNIQNDHPLLPRQPTNDNLYEEEEEEEELSPSEIYLIHILDETYPEEEVDEMREALFKNFDKWEPEWQFVIEVFFKRKPVTEFKPIDFVSQLRKEFKSKQVSNTNGRQENPTSCSLVFGHNQNDAAQEYEELINLLVKNDPKEITAYKSRYKLDDEIKFIMEHYDLQKFKHEEQLPETVIEKLQNKFELSAND